jgi:hypothetical protein
VVLLTSLAAITLGRARCGLDAERLRVAALSTLDCIWTVLAFLMMNVVGCVGVVIVGRILPGDYVSSYTAGDVTLVVLSTVQGIAFHLWRRADRES